MLNLTLIIIIYFDFNYFYLIFNKEIMVINKIDYKTNPKEYHRQKMYIKRKLTRLKEMWEYHKQVYLKNVWI